MTFNYLIWLFVKPSHFIFILLIVGVVLWRTKIGRRCRNAGCILIVALGLLPFGSLLMKPLESRFEQPTNLDQVDGVIVLAGSESVALSDLYDQPQLTAAGDRLTTFLILAERYPTARLAHSGHDEILVAKQLFFGVGIDPQRILLEEQSRNTCDSAVKLKEALSPRPNETWLLVTSASHIPRSVACFRAQDWDVTAFPADYRVGAIRPHFGMVANLQTLDLAMHEWIGLIYYRLRGRTDELFPAP
ncbi:MAG: YdcF family protein [Pseudomonadota bacterium]